MGSGEVRIVLRWQKDPKDLDLHVCDSEGDHVYFSTKSADNGSITLDIDVQSGFGPETLTLLPKSGVTYCVYVHHYSGEGTLASSGATLSVFGIPGLDTILIPSGACIDYKGNSESGYWHAFKFTVGGRAEIINQIVSKATGTGAAQMF